jgi:hypothetical protein
MQRRKSALELTFMTDFLIFQHQRELAIMIAKQSNFLVMPCQYRFEALLSIAN